MMMKPYLLLLGAATAASFGLVDAAGTLIYLPALLAVLLASLWPSAETRPWRRPDRSFDGFLLVWAFYLFASMTWSAWPQATFWLGIVVACVPLVTLAGSRRFQSDDAWAIVRRLMQVTALVYAGWLLIEFFNSGGRSSGPLLDPNAGGALVNLFLLPTLWAVWAPTTRRPERLQQLLLISLLAAALLTTASRGAMLSLAGACALSVAVLLVFRLPFSRRGLLASIAAFAVGVAVIHLGPETPVSRNMTDFIGDTSAKARLMLWQSTWEMYLDHPVLGAGFGAFAALYPQYRSPHESGTSGTFAHNDYLQFLAEGGPLLLIMLLLFGLAVVRWAGVLLIRGSDQRGRTEYYEGLGLAAGIAAIFAQAGVNFIFYIAPLALWIGIYAGRLRALAIGIARLPQHHPAPVPTLYHRSAPLLLGAAGALAAVLLATDILSYYRLSFERLAPNDYQVGSPRFQTALAISYVSPINTHASEYLIRAQTKLALDNLDAEFIGRFMAEAALRDIEQLASVRTAICAPRVLKARLLAAFPPLKAQPKMPSPEQVLVQTLKERPDCLQAVLALAKIRRDRGDLESALQVLEAGNDWMQLRNVNKNLRLEVLEETARTYLGLGRPDQALLVALVVLSNDSTNDAARQIVEAARSRLAAAGKDSL